MLHLHSHLHSHLGNLADAFIQSDLQGVPHIHSHLHIPPLVGVLFKSVCVSESE